MARIITDEDVIFYLKNPAVTEYMVLRDKLQELENAREDIKSLKTELENYIDKYFLESQKVLKLNKVLKEIKEIAKKQCVCGIDCIDMKQILQKISEVENEHN